MLSGFVILAAVSFQATKAQTPQNIIAVEKVRAKVNKLGVGRNIRVEVKLHDDTKLKGYISAINPDSFNLTDAEHRRFSRRRLCRCLRGQEVRRRYFLANLDNSGGRSHCGDRCRIYGS